MLPTLLIAMPRSSSLTNKSLYSVGTRSERTGIKTGWGMQNKHPSMVDLSEWGDKDPHVLKHQNGLFVFLKK